MQAIVCHRYGPPKNLQFENAFPDPRPAKGEVLVKVKACSLNFPDLLYIAGKYQIKPPMPFVPGGEVSGVVEGLGEGVTGFEVGQAVFAGIGWGGLAERVTIPATGLAKMPEGMDFLKASALTVTYGTAYHALKDRAGLKQGENLLVLGAAGGVGTAAIQLGKAFGARVFAAASTEQKQAYCQEQGADEVLFSGTAEFRDRLRSAAKGAKMDVVFDPIGGELSNEAFRELGWAGRHLVIGFAAGKIPQLPFNIPLLKSASLVGVFFTDFRKRFPDQYRVNMEELLGLYQSGLIDPVIKDVHPLSIAPLALQQLADRQQLGKSVVQIGVGGYPSIFN